MLNEHICKKCKHYDKDWPGIGCCFLPHCIGSDKCIVEGNRCENPLAICLSYHLKGIPFACMYKLEHIVNETQ
jgi:hypothetical protein